MPHHTPLISTIVVALVLAFILGALANLWGTRGRHPGWMLMAAALGLIAVGVG